MAYETFDIPEHIKNAMDAARTITAAGVEVFNEFVRAYQAESEMKDLLIRAHKELRAKCRLEPASGEGCRKCPEAKCVANAIAWYLEV